MYLNHKHIVHYDVVVFVEELSLQACRVDEEQGGCFTEPDMCAEHSAEGDIKQSKQSRKQIKSNANGKPTGRKQPLKRCTPKKRKRVSAEKKRKMQKESMKRRRNESRNMMLNGSVRVDFW